MKNPAKLFHTLPIYKRKFLQFGIFININSFSNFHRMIIVYLRKTCHSFLRTYYTTEVRTTEISIAFLGLGICSLSIESSQKPPEACFSNIKQRFLIRNEFYLSFFNVVVCTAIISLGSFTCHLHQFKLLFFFTHETENFMHVSIVIHLGTKKR